MLEIRIEHHCCPLLPALATKTMKLTFPSECGFPLSDRRRRRFRWSRRRTRKPQVAPPRVRGTTSGVATAAEATNTATATAFQPASTKRKYAAHECNRLTRPGLERRRSNDMSGNGVPFYPSVKESSPGQATHQQSANRSSQRVTAAPAKGGR